MQQSPRRERRRNTQERDASKGKAKFQETRMEEARSKPITPMNRKQADYLRLLEDPDCSIIIATRICRHK